ncbi:MAG: competence/damage-inducible protein A [Clostridia bacterium]|nr:competence/damage-inducible protein A [Clostridia bacterium]
MNAEILAIGTELLMGQIANTNAQFITARLSELGLNVHYHTVVGDNAERLKESLDLAFKRSDCVIMTGGLGPTYDDMTKETVAEYFNMPLKMDEAALSQITEYFKSRGREMTPSNAKQALIPEGAVTLYNKFGTAPGVLIEKDGKIAVMMPGPPREMKPMFTEYLIPFFEEKSGVTVKSDFIRIFGMGEAEAEKKIAHLTSSSNPTVAPYVNPGELSLRISARAKTKDEAEALIAPVKKEIYEIFGDLIYGEGLTYSLPQCILDLLRKKKLTFASAESCTGGMIASAITDLSGSSEVFLYGAVTYANSAKVNALGVSPETLEKCGAVSEETVLQMAKGVRLKAGSDIGVSTSGIAGPTGGTPDKPVGTVWIAISTKRCEKAFKLFIPGARDRVRNSAMLHVYDLIRRTIKEDLV